MVEPKRSRTASQMATTEVSPSTKAAATAASARLSPVTTEVPRMMAGQAGKKAQRLPSPSWISWAG